MDLILWRHAEAEPGEPDLERALTPKGRKQARRTADWLDRHLPEKCRILVSPALRTLQTADALDRPYKVHPDLAPDVSVDRLLSAADWPDAKEPVLVVGHQPTFGLTVARLIAGVDQEWSMKKGSAWWIARRKREDGTPCTILRAVITPELLTRSRD